LGIQIKGDNGLPAKKNEAVAIVDIGEQITNVSIISAGLPRFTRDIFVAGSDFTKHLSVTLGVSLEEAERLKCNPGTRKDEILKACESVFLNLVSDMRLSFDYFVTEHNMPITRILLGGGASRLEGMTEFFASCFEIEIERWDPFHHVEVPAEQKQEIEKVSGQLGVALGLALYG